MGRRFILFTHGMSGFRFQRGTYAVRVTTAPEDLRVFQIEDSLTGGPEVAHVTDRTGRPLRSVRVNSARDLYLLLREVFEQETHPMAGLTMVEQEARRAVAARNGYGAATTPEAVAAWDALNPPARQRELRAARQRLEAGGVLGPTGLRTDPDGAMLEARRQVEYRAIGGLARSMIDRRGDLAYANELWAEMTPAQRQKFVDPARRAVAADLIQQRARQLYADEAGIEDWRTVSASPEDGWGRLVPAATTELLEDGVLEPGAAPPAVAWTDE